MSDITKFFKEHSVLSTLLMMLGISFVILFIVFMLIKVYARQGQEYELPDMVGLNMVELEETNNLNLDFVVVDSTYNAGDDGGTVLTQDPKAGTKIKKGRKVYLTITAHAPGDAVMPNLLDMTVRQAISQLESDGLQGGKLTFEDSPFRNAVLRQTYKGRTIKKGDNLPRGSYIDLSIGMGEGQNSSVVPFVIGKTAAQARRDILTSSLNVGKEHFNGVKDKSKAVVVKQNPDYTGVSRYPYGTAVDLWYKDASKVDVEKMVKEFKVDSSQIIQEQPDSREEDYIMEENDW